ncbi:hypothetical protein EMIT0215P_60076 [Pseudomonas serboccidentalis]
MKKSMRFDEKVQSPYLWLIIAEPKHRR